MTNVELLDKLREQTTYDTGIGEFTEFTMDRESALAALDSLEPKDNGGEE